MGISGFNLSTTRFAPMPTLYDLKPGFQRLLRPLVTRLAAAGITPNQVTIATCICAIVVGIVLAAAQRAWALLPAFLSGWRSMPSTACLRVSTDGSRGWARCSMNSQT